MFFTFTSFALSESQPVKKQETTATKGQDERKKDDRAMIDVQLENFVYTSKGKRDPFFATALYERKKTVAVKEEKVYYELEELKIVGILKTDRGFFAMMEDKQGNGILFKVGDYINKNMWIQEIRNDRIVFAYKLKDEIRTITMDVPKK